MKEYILLSLLLFSVGAFAEDASEEDYSDAVILSSDNEADLTAAESAAENSGASVISTAWGEYNEAAVEALMAKNPSKIVIVGGPAAIPHALENRIRERLRERNITVIRVMGQDRYETAVEIATHFWGNSSDVMLIQGDDTAEMRRRLIEAKQLRIPVLYMKKDQVPDVVKQRLTLWKVKKARMYLAPDSNETALDNELADSQVVNVTKVKENLTDRALAAIEAADSAITKAEEVINVTDEANTTTIAASRLLVLAKEKYKLANDALDNETYGRAFGQATAARVHVLAAVKIQRNVLSGDYNKQVERIRNEIRERGIESIRQEVRQELRKVELRRKVVSAVVRAGRQGIVESSNIENTADTANTDDTAAMNQ